MSRKERIQQQIKSLRSLISDLEHSLIELEDVGKTSESEKETDWNEILRQLEKDQKTGGPFPAPFNYPKQSWECVTCGQRVFNGVWHMCSGKQYPNGAGGWQCQCGTFVGSMQVHSCQWRPGVIC
jgi:hypothetical protein